MSEATRPLLVVGYDGREPAIKALEEAFDVARTRSAELLVLVVAGIPMETVDPYEPAGIGLGYIAPIPPEGPPEIQPIMEDARSRIEAAGVPGTVEWSIGDPAGEILRVAKEQDAAAIVVGTHHHSAIGRLLGTDTAADLMRDAPCDVLVAR